MGSLRVPDILSAAAKHPLFSPSPAHTRRGNQHGPVSTAPMSHDGIKPTMQRPSHVRDGLRVFARPAPSKPVQERTRASQLTLRTARSSDPNARQAALSWKASAATELLPTASLIVWPATCTGRLGSTWMLVRCCGCGRLQCQQLLECGVPQQRVQSCCLSEDTRSRMRASCRTQAGRPEDPQPVADITSSLLSTSSARRLQAASSMFTRPPAATHGAFSPVKKAFGLLVFVFILLVVFLFQVFVVVRAPGHAHFAWALPRQQGPAAWLQLLQAVPTHCCRP